MLKAEATNTNCIAIRIDPTGARTPDQPHSSQAR